MFASCNFTFVYFLKIVQLKGTYSKYLTISLTHGTIKKVLLCD